MVRARARDIRFGEAAAPRRKGGERRNGPYMSTVLEVPPAMLPVVAVVSRLLSLPLLALLIPRVRRGCLGLKRVWIRRAVPT